jgi:serine/threonine-protein kinase
MVPPSVAVRAWNGSVDVASASALGRATGAGLVLLGSLLGRGGDSVRISATLVDTREGQPLGDIEIGGTRERVDVIVDSLAVEILRALGAAGRVVPLPHSRLSARSLPALKVFLTGEMALRRGAWDTAQSAFREAVRLDSAFALAWIRLGMTTLYLDVQGGPGWQYILRAAEVPGGLSRHDSLLLDGAVELAAFMGGQVPPDSAASRAGRVYATALALTRDYPDDPEAWYLLGSVRDLLFTLLPVTWSDVADAYTRATVLDSTFVPAYAAALRYVLGVGDTVLGARLARTFLSLGLPDATRGLPLLIDRMLDPSVSVADRDRLLDSLPPEALFRGWIRLWLLPDSAERAIQVARAIQRRPHDPRYWFTAPRIGRRDLAASLAYRGHVREAFALAGTDDDGWFSNLLPDLAMLGVVPPAVADSALRDWVRREPLREGGLKWSYWWWARRGDTTSLATAVERSESPRSDAMAALAVAQGDTAGAIRHFEAWRPLYNDDPQGMIVYARLLAATGREREALTALEREFFTDWPLAARVLWRLERARLAERLGESAQALDDYAFVAAVWRDADPELARYVAEARDGEGRLSDR